MKIHLPKRMIGAYGIEFIGLLCTRDPFIKGMTVTYDEFEKLNPEHRCKKCERIYYKKK